MSLDVMLFKCERCPHCQNEIKGERIYSRNITHNLGKMANAAGIYEVLWRPDEEGLTRAYELTRLLTEGLQNLKENPSKYKQYDSPNGWGTYENFVLFVEDYLQALLENPDSFVEVSR